MTHFNPRAPCGARPNHLENFEQTVEFQSTRPMRGATTKLYVYDMEGKFQSTRPMRGATAVWSRPLHPKVISIHAPHAGRDYRA